NEKIEISAILNENIISVKDLEILFQTYKSKSKAVRCVSFNLKKGETLAIIGESGSGKSVTAKSIMKLLSKKDTLINQGSILYNDKDLLANTYKEMEKIRGKKISMVF